MIKRISIVLLIIFSLALTSCALHYPDNGVHTQSVRTLSSNALVMFPTVANEQRIYLTIRGHIDAHSMLALQRALTSLLNARGYSLVSNASAANYQLKINIRALCPGTEDAAQDILLQGYAGAIWPAGAIAVGKERYLATAPRSPFAYLMVVDLRINKMTGRQADGNIYQTRLVSEYPNGLKFATFAEAKPELIQGMAQFIATLW